MKNIFIEAHKLTKEMVEKYGVDYQAQFGLNISYLLEKEEEEVLNNNIKEELETLGIEVSEIEKAETILAKYSTVNREFTARMYDNKNLRRAMKSRKLWNDKDFGISAEDRYLGKGECKVTRQKLWAKADKIRIYFDVLVDGEISSKDHWIKIK